LGAQNPAMTPGQDPQPTDDPTRALDDFAQRLRRAASTGPAPDLSELGDLSGLASRIHPERAAEIPKARGGVLRSGQRWRHDEVEDVPVVDLPRPAPAREDRPELSLPVVDLQAEDASAAMAPGVDLPAVADAPPPDLAGIDATTRHASQLAATQAAAQDAAGSAPVWQPDAGALQLRPTAHPRLLAQWQREAWVGVRRQVVDGRTQHDRPEDLALPVPIRRQPPRRQGRAISGDRGGRRSGAALRTQVALGARGRPRRSSSPGDCGASAAGEGQPARCRPVRGVLPALDPGALDDQVRHLPEPDRVPARALRMASDRREAAGRRPAARESMLLAGADWSRTKELHHQILGLPDQAMAFLEPILAGVSVGLTALAEAAGRGQIEIGADKLLHLPPIRPMDEEVEPRKTREAVFKHIGSVQLPDLLLEVDAATHFSEALLARRPSSSNELLAIYGALLAHGTDLDAKGVGSMIPGIDAAHISTAMRAVELSGRLRRANERVSEYQNALPIAALWGDGTKGSADMMAMDASRHLWTARVDPRRRTYAAGLYTHVRDRWGLFYDQPVVLNERQAGVAVEGVEQHNRAEDRIRISLLAVDTHGVTNVAMAAAKLLGFDLCPRLRDLRERKLFVPRGWPVPESLEGVTVRRVSVKAIERGWDDLVRLAASIRAGKVSAAHAIHRLGSAAVGDPLHRAAEHLGRLLRTLFLCDYLAIPDYRREIHTLLNRGESVHQLQRAIHGGQVAPERGRRRQEMAAISGAHALLTNIVLAWNTNRMDTVVTKLNRDGVGIEEDWLRRIGPAHFSHINFRGTFRFNVERYADVLVERAAGRGVTRSGQ
jgi:TnpA family transposase